MFASKLVSTPITVQVVYSTDYLLFDRSMRTKTKLQATKKTPPKPKDKVPVSTKKNSDTAASDLLHAHSATPATALPLSTYRHARV